MIQVKIRVDTILIFSYEAISIAIDINYCFRHYSRLSNKLNMNSSMFCLYLPFTKVSF